LNLSEEGFLLNINDGVDTIHRLEGLTERCNTDDVVGRQRIDGATATSMLEREQAVRCQHCNEEEA